MLTTNFGLLLAAGSFPFLGWIVKNSSIASQARFLQYFQAVKNFKIL